MKPSDARIAMFGQGLEAATGGLARELLWGASTPFKITGLHRGQQGKNG
jgi:hypothetical protein